ncbi:MULTISPECIES: hypothetical protein [Janthinobacterium]|uniref:Uncharacterized protein n=1 Tax=Janthinobacterium kumbetense TaxID=2950280 RepID=A0ABT0WLP5_9BURK|nr:MULTISPECIES: hypothetical protein [Janthinobacterium]MCM2564778.1 hypothetical protein [Janthinobacterium kumbetense]MDN2671821.1 hypothetical protein [Janthinobacterium sp. SUN026]MDN2676222.1 hypothetical protein [Janthinobacterium sp. SUN033]
MAITDSLRQLAYAQAAAFVQTLDTRDPVALQRDWGLSPGVADEIIEMLDSYFAANQALSLAPLAQAFVPGKGGRVAVDVYATDAGPLGLECLLLADGQPGEATLHLEMSGHDGALRLHYHYIGS